MDGVYGRSFQDINIADEALYFVVISLACPPLNRSSHNVKKAIWKEPRDPKGFRES